MQPTRSYRLSPQIFHQNFSPPKSFPPNSAAPLVFALSTAGRQTTSTLSLSLSLSLYSSVRFRSATPWTELKRSCQTSDAVHGETQHTAAPFVDASPARFRPPRESQHSRAVRFRPRQVMPRESPPPRRSFQTTTATPRESQSTATKTLSLTSDPDERLPPPPSATPPTTPVPFVRLAGIMYQDITTLLLDHKAFKDTVDIFVDRYGDMGIKKISLAFLASVLFLSLSLFGFLQMWPNLIQKAKEGGLDVIQTCVFWNGHEPSPGQYYFEGNYDLVKFIKLVKQAGLYVNLRESGLVLMFVPSGTLGDSLFG